MATYFLAANLALESTDLLRASFIALFDKWFAVAMVVVAVLAVGGIAWLCGYLWNRKWRPFENDNMGSVAVMAVFVVLLFCSATVFCVLNGRSFIAEPEVRTQIEAMEAVASMSDDGKWQTLFDRRFELQQSSDDDEKDKNKTRNMEQSSGDDEKDKDKSENMRAAENFLSKLYKDAKVGEYVTPGEFESFKESVEAVLTMRKAGMHGMWLFSLALMAYASFNGFSRIKQIEMDKELKSFAESAEELIDEGDSAGDLEENA